MLGGNKKSRQDIIAGPSVRVNIIVRSTLCNAQVYCGITFTQITTPGISARVQRACHSRFAGRA
jgi:hypothetical protein